MLVKESIQFDGKELSLELGQLARQAGGSVLAAYGDTRVLVTAAVQENKRNVSYFPLRVDYEERFYATGKIPGGFFKREGRPSEEAILNARMIDRPIRPLFPEGYDDEVQIIATVLSVDPNCSPGILGIVGASAALMVSEAPFQGPIAGVEVGLVDGEFAVNPGFDALEESPLDITVAGSKSTVTMVEGHMDELTEDQIIEAIQLASGAIQEIISLQERFAAHVDVKKREVAQPEIDYDLQDKVHSITDSQFPSMSSLSSKKEFQAFVNSLREQAIEQLVDEELTAEEKGELEDQISGFVDSAYKEYMREGILERGERIDGRRPDEVRSIDCHVGNLPRAHGSALFTRGETQSLAVVTLGASRSDEQIIDQMTKEGRKRFMLHYNFPPFSVGEVRPMRGPNRRAIGHGHLAEGALRPVLPSEEDFPYTLRVVSEILESNGSSSMASVCGGSLAMMDAGVPIRKPVAGIAMGMIEDESSGKRVILTDILGEEDHFGDMDFKVTGTKDGVTGFQLDVKVGGIGKETMRQALEQAKKARLSILDEMVRTIPAPRDQLSEFAPSLKTITIPAEKIGAVIGPGGKMIRQIIEETGAEIDIEDDGQVTLAGENAKAVAAAEQWIEDLTAELEEGAVITTKVTRIVDFGAFVELKNGSEGLVHVSNLASGFVDNVGDIVKPGDEITIKVIGKDKMGRPDLKRIDDAESDSGKKKGRKSTEDTKKAHPEINEGDIIEGTVANTVDYGAFVTLYDDVTGLIHISELADEYVKKVEDVVKTGDKVTVEVLKVDDRGRYKLHRVVPEEEREKEEKADAFDFEDRW